MASISRGFGSVAVWILLSLTCSRTLPGQGIVPHEITDTTIICHPQVIKIVADTVWVAHVCAPLSWWTERMGIHPPPVAKREDSPS